MTVVTISNAIVWIFEIYRYALIFYFILSFFPQAGQVPLTRYLAMVTEPYLAIFRRFIPPIGILDLSALVGYIATYFVQSGVISVVVWIYELIGKVS
ncbi:YggT family protein [Risungbinella massiliensis]|uniref:YggT family protein n=1 Tax=Risungbinella massiliensis TaxID=1329796 RepID=UPI0005CC4FF3|nr:YggT family protein [Risungbinella massiliensis]